ncbi:MAG: CRISPR-associated endonuclease Cas2 [Patescibacteria group bacterium]
MKITRMGVVEKKARKVRRLRTFQKAILIAAVGGVMVATGAVPNFNKILKYLLNRKNDARFRYQANSALRRLAGQGLITFEERDGKRYARATETGERMLELESLREKNEQKPKRWDGRWRVVLFDIPERRRRVRNLLRAFMQEFGLVRLQDSVWIYPYDCEDIIALAKAHFRIGFDVLYMVVEQLERDKHLREHFSLPLA